MFPFRLLLLSWSIITVLSAPSDFSLTIPIYFDIPKHLGFLVPKTQSLLDNMLSQHDFSIDYNTKIMLGTGPSYTVKLEYALDEAFLVSPYGKTIYVYQTDLLIAHNKIPEFIAQLIMDFVLKTEIEYFDKDNSDTVDGVGIELGPRHDVSVFVKGGKDYVWDSELFEYLIQPVINELEDLIYLNVEFDYRYEAEVPVLHLEEIESILNYDRLTFLIYLSSIDQEFCGIDSKNIIIPKKGAVQLVKIDQTLEEMKQIEILEVLTGQLFRLLGMEASEPKSPFIRIDFLIRRQIYINYQKLDKEKQSQLDKLLEKAKWGDALRLSWALLRS